MNGEVNVKRALPFLVLCIWAESVTWACVVNMFICIDYCYLYSLVFN